MKFRDTPPPTASSSYPQGFAALRDEVTAQREAFAFQEGDLPDPALDFAPLKTQLIPREGPWSGPRPVRYDYAQNAAWMRFRFGGQSALCHLAACLIMLSRRENMPPDMVDLWHRLWDEEAAFLVEHLNVRWKISALRTFGSHGRSELERRLGREIFLVTGMMKLADSERNFSGHGASDHFKLGNRKNDPVALGLEAYSVPTGDLDLHILAMLSDTVEALSGTGAGLLGRDVLTQIDAAPDTVFRRLMVIRDKFRRSRQKR